MGRDETLRAERLVFYQQDVERLDGELDSFLELSNAKSAMLIDKDGHLVTRRGEPLQAPTESVSALIAGSFAATKEMARLMGEDEFSSLCHQGARDHIQLQLIGDRTLLAILFDDRTNLGLVRFYAQEAGRRLSETFTEIAEREPIESESLSDEFGADASRALDDLF